MLLKRKDDNTKNVENNGVKMSAYTTSNQNFYYLSILLREICVSGYYCRHVTTATHYPK